MTTIPVYSDETFEKELRGYKEKVKYHAIITKSEIRQTKQAGYDMPTFDLLVNCDRDLKVTLYLPLIPQDFPGHHLTIKKAKDFLTAAGEPYVENAFDRIEKYNNKELKVILAPSDNNSDYPSVKKCFPLSEMNENPEVQEEKPKSIPRAESELDDDVPF